MHFAGTLRILAAMVSLLALAAAMTFPESQDLGNGFRLHGVATPISNHRGVVATVDGRGRPVALAWLFDHRGGYEILLVDAETGQSEEFPVPFPPGGDCPYASILSSSNKYYSHFNSYFSEFDPAKRAFTFWRQTAPQMAMSMTEDDQGRIWSATYPQSGVVSFDPKTRTLRDYGHVYPQNWNEYPRSIATDDAGWVYFGVGSTKSQIVVLNPETGKATPAVPEDQRGHGYGYVYRSLDGKVYGQALREQKDNWMMFHKGKATAIGAHTQPNPKPYIAGGSNFFHREFPGGLRLKAYDLVDRILIVENPATKAEKKFKFDYSTEGAIFISLAAAPDNTICGGTAFPFHFFRYDPIKDEWTNRAAYGQYNTLGRQGPLFYMGCYGGGFLLEYDPAKPWIGTEKGNNNSNPLYLVGAAPDINRPHRLVCHPDGRTIILGGTPAYGLTGGGLLFWDRQTKQSVLLTHQNLIPEQSTISLAPLPKGRLLGGSTTAPGTGGEKKSEEAELYILDMAGKKIEWHKPVLPGVQEYTDLCIGPDGLAYGFADRTKFFVFDPIRREILHKEQTETAFGKTVYQQGPRVFVRGPNEEIYILFVKGIAQVDPKTHKIRMLAESPVSVDHGGDYLDGRIYFASGSRVCSYAVSKSARD
jgi:hypothetical protein